ncbi:succinyldiaminopimelate transaminase [Kineobactrum salinum]|uniref:Succinyldiaminopimelate transaminase n=1 Tax=Kineobactrum salinum TaxID=2708301 RepID=A0A6C0UA83_9GAMM|nr:succinyldiaminopimelate transaminase [Kineobactrum salinum]QIB66684.1 succinyldiaminopimelate transaminase [Kineobactrum salinum]
MNPLLELLQPYPFERLRTLLADLQPPSERAPILLSVGEPRHPSPAFVLEALTQALPRLANYPATRGEDALRETIAGWLQRRFQLQQIDPDTQVLPVNGTREALFAFAQAVVAPGPEALVLSPNPFYQIYEGAALLAGARPGFINATAATGYLPDFAGVTEDWWQRCQLLYICSPGNPSGAVMPLQQLQELVELAEKHDFIIASDECYSEIYGDEQHPPPGLLQACAALGNDDYHRCVVFHSLSKRSNLPGLRSGFVAGDARVLAAFLRYRTYHGCAMPLHHQYASIAAWSDEQHVVANRQLYREKFDAVLGILQPRLDVQRPDAGFYLWPSTPLDDTEFARQLYAREHLTVVPGRYLARDTAAGNPGANRVRLALVAPIDDCIDAARRILRCLGES